MSRLVWMGLLMGLVLGCGGGRAPEVSPVRKELDNYSAKAAIAFKRGDLEQARALFLESLRMSMSIEDTDATAVNLINLAAVERAMGEHKSARARLVEIFDPIGAPYPGARLADAAMLQSLIEIDTGGLAEAHEWALKAEAHCARSGCRLKGRISNLRGRISLLRDKHAEAISHAQKGLGLARSESEPGEEANALRLMADAHFIMAAHAKAVEFYTEALDIDKRLGHPSKIALDLKGIGVSLAAMGRTDEAAAYLARSITVSGSAGDIKTEEETRMILKRLIQADK